MTAGEGDDRSIDATRRCDRTERIQDAGAQLGVPEPDRRVGEIADEHRPQIGAVGLPGAELEHDVDLSSGGVEVAGPGHEASGDGVAVHRRADPPAHSLAGEGSLRVGIALGSDQLEPLGHAHVPGVGLPDPLAQPGGLLDELRRLAEPAVQQLERRPPGEREVAETRLTHGLGSGQIGVQGRPECRRTGLEEGIGGEQQSFRPPLLITQPFGDPDDVAGQAEPFLGAARGPQHVVAGQEAGQEGSRVVGLPGELERLLAQGLGPGPVVRDRVLELSGHGGGELGLERDVVPGDRLSRRLERLDHVMAPHREPSPQVLQPEGDGPDPGGILAGFGVAPRTHQQLSGALGLACPGQCFRLGDQQIYARGLGEDDAGLRQRQPSAGEVAGRLGERQARKVRFRRRERPLHDAVGAPGRGRAGVVLGHLRGRDTAALVSPVLERHRDPAMEGDSLGGSERGVQGLPEQVVGEP